jgi:hypothetical protein
MVVIWKRQAVRPRSAVNVWRRIGRVIVGATLLVTPHLAYAGTTNEFEQPPVLNAKALVAPRLLRGKGFQVDEKVPTDGAMGIFTIRASADVFRENAGTYQVRGRELLELRLAEVPAIVKLQEVSKTGTFVKAMAASGARPLEAGWNIVTNPADTVAGLPSGVGRFFDRVETGAGNLWDSPASDKGGLERTGEITRDALGYEQERRKLAHQLGVDPYTSNPILARKLDEVAWVSFAGRLTVSTAISVAVPGSMIITGVRTMDDLVWDTPRGDLVVRVETKLEELKVPRDQITCVSHNPAVPLSLQVSVVENLSRLSGVTGRGDAVRLLCAAVTESQARFLATAVRMLADYHEKKKPITAMAAHGPLIARDRDGALVLPAPVDYLSWTKRIAAFATNPDFLATPQRTLWLAGKLSARARTELAANGWTVQEAVSP